MFKIIAVISCIVLFSCKTNNDKASSVKDVIPSGVPGEASSDQTVSKGCFVESNWDLCKDVRFTKRDDFLNVIKMRPGEGVSLGGNVLTFVDSKKELLVLRSYRDSLSSEKVLNGSREKSLKEFSALFSDHTVLTPGSDVISAEKGKSMPEGLRKSLSPSSDFEATGRIVKLQYCTPERTGCYDVGAYAVKRKRVLDDTKSMNGSVILALCNDYKDIYNFIPSDATSFGKVCDFYYDQDSKQLKIRMKI